jgi:uncharacterized protein YndB with AHSA1/START domain
MSQLKDRSVFTVRINIDASKEAIFEAWTSQELLELWFLRLAEFTDADGNLRGRFDKIQKGDSYKWLWHGYPDNTEERGTVLECNGADLLKFSFGKAGNCTVTIKEMLGENVLEMRQENIPPYEGDKPDFYLECQLGWTFYFANLKSILEGGIDLRNKNETLKGMMNS